MFGFRFNPDYLRRDQLLGFNEEWGKTYVGGIGYIEQLEAGKLEVLIEEQSVAPDIGHNQAPTPLEFLGFVQDHPQARAGSYAVSPPRADYAVLLTSVHIDDAYMTPPWRQQFASFAASRMSNRPTPWDAVGAIDLAACQLADADPAGGRECNDAWSAKLRDDRW